MVPDEETKRMLPAAQPVPMSDLEMNERSAALRSSHDDPPPYKSSNYDPKVAGIYGWANYCASLRSLFALPMLILAALIVAQKNKPTTSWIALPWGAYCVVCASIHLLLIAHRAVSPRGGRRRGNMLPGRTYIAVMIASSILLLLAVGGAAAVLHLTKEHFDERDKSNGMTARCGKSRRPCYPKTPEGFVFDLTCAQLAFSSAAWVCTLKQCYDMFQLSRRVYTEEEIQSETNRVSKATFCSIMRGSW